MQRYPDQFPTDAMQVVITVATSGFAPDGEHADAACFYQALWNIQGYALHIWKPHVHELKAGAPPRPAKLGRFVAPRTDKQKIDVLVKCLEQVRETSESFNVETEDKYAKRAAVDWSNLPWEQIIMLVTLIIQSILKKQPAN